MKTTGIVRKVDELGRITLPVELRRTLDVEVKDSMEIFIDGDKIIMKKYEPSDVFSGSTDHLIEYKGKMVSVKSIKEMAKIAKIL